MKSLLLILSSLLTGCVSYPPMPPVQATEMDLEVIWMESWEVDHYVKSLDTGNFDMPTHSKAFSEWEDIDGRRHCTIRVAKPTDQGDYKANRLISHELDHCIFGDFHH